MKKYQLTVCAALLSLGLLTGACSSNRNMSSGNKVDQAASDANATLERERLELKQDIQQSMDKIDARLDKLKEESKDATDDAKANLQKESEKLEKSREKLNNYLSDVGKQTQSNWSKFKADVRSSFEELKADIKD